MSPQRTVNRELSVLQDADRKFGESPIWRLKWMLRLLQEKAPWCEEVWRAQITAFAARASKGNLERLHWGLFHIGPLLPDERTAQRVVGKMREHLEQLFTKGRIDFPSAWLPYTIIRNPGGQVSGFSLSTRAEDLFWMSFRQLLTEVGHKLRHCFRCHKLFFLTRSDKEHCSKTCQSTAKTRRRRGTPEERYDKRGRPPIVTRDMR